MQQIKIFKGVENDLVALENEVNAWLAKSQAVVKQVVGNIAPAAMSELVRAFRSGNVARARELHYQLFDLCRAMFIETNPIPVKTAAGILGLCSAELRLPMSPMSDANRHSSRNRVCIQMRR